MTTEFWLFLIVGAIAVVSAMMMLLSDTAVHSALFLILVMGCIAFMFLMLNAPFLAMVQIIVYAGAIMVLFLFVIMLLGVQRLSGGTPFRWIAPGAVVLSLLLLGVIGLALGSGAVSEFTPPPAQPQVRIAHFAPDAGIVDVHIGDTVVEDAVSFGDSIGYVSLPAGEYDLSLVETGTDNVLITQDLTLEEGLVGTVIAYGDGEQPTLAFVPDDLSVVDERSARVTLFNAYTEVPAVSLVDLGNEFDDEDTQVLLERVPSGEQSPVVQLPETTDMRTWALVEAGNEANELARLNNADVFDVERDTSTLLVVGTDRRFEGSTRPVVIPLVAAAAPAFGSPVDVGQLLFSRYMLPMQAVAVLLLVAMVGAIVLTHKPSPSAALARARMGRRRVSRPLTSVIASQVGQDISRTTGNGPAELPGPNEEPAGD